MASPMLAAPGSFLPNAGTVATRCQQLEELLAFLLAGLAGGADESLAVSGGTVTPSRAIVRVDTAGGAGSANLDTIATTNLAAYGTMILRCQDATRVVTVRSGFGNISLAGSVAMVLDHPTAMLWLQRTATGFTELFRWHGRSQAAARTWLGLGATATQGFASLGEHEAGALTDKSATPAGVAWMLGASDLVIGDRDELGGYQKTAELLVSYGDQLYRGSLELLLSKSFAADYTTAELAIANAGGGSGLAHGLGGVPRSWQVILRCKSAELGYALGDEVPYAGDGLQVRADAANLAYRYAATAAPISILHATTGALTAVTNASWRALVRVFR